MELSLYIIYWYPKHRGDCEKNESYVLCNNINEVKRIAKEKYDGVQVVEVCSYESVSGGNKGQEYWADYIVYNNRILTYAQFKYYVNEIIVLK